MPGCMVRHHVPVIGGAALSMNPGPDDARPRSRSFSDAAALFQPIIPAAGTPVAVHAPVAPLPEPELPPAIGPQPIPDAPRVPPVVARADPVVFRPAPVVWERPVAPVADVPVEPAAFEPPPSVPEPTLQTAAPAPLPPQVRRRWWPMLVLPAVVVIIAGLAWSQLAPWRTPSSDATQGATGQTPAVTPDEPAAPVAPAPPSPAPTDPIPPSPDASATGAAVPDRTPPVPSPDPVPSAPVAAEAPPIIQPEPPSPEPAVVEPDLPIPPVPPAVEPARQLTAPGTTAAGTPLTFPIVAIRMRAGSPAAQAEASRISSLLKASAARLDVQTVPTSLRTPTIRYFWTEDAASARALASALPRTGRPWQVQGMRTQRNSVPGRLEVWVAEP